MPLLSVGEDDGYSFFVMQYIDGVSLDWVIRRLIDEHFDFRPREIIDRFDLRRPIYRQTAAYGHFGRPDLDLPWEKTDLAATFARSAGSRTAAV